jgi:hypothetical protein
MRRVFCCCRDSSIAVLAFARGFGFVMVPVINTSDSDPTSFASLWISRVLILRLIYQVKTPRSHKSFHRLNCLCPQSKVLVRSITPPLCTCYFSVSAADISSSNSTICSKIAKRSRSDSALP